MSQSCFGEQQNRFGTSFLGFHSSGNRFRTSLFHFRTSEITALARFDPPAASHADNQMPGWTLTNQPAQFLIEQCNNGTGAPVPDASSLVAGNLRSISSIGELWARVTSADADGNPISPASPWIYFQENE